MAEPSTVAVVAVPAVVGTTAAAMLPGVDLNAVIGAMAGALFFVAWARDLHPMARIAYLITSWIGGYFAAVEAVVQSFTRYSGLPALLSAALIVTALISVLEWIKTGQMPGWIKASISWTRGVLMRVGGSNG